ncbi:MAG: hypothetical protein WAO35_05500 [Terriglobia bacterium]
MLSRMARVVALVLPVLFTLLSASAGAHDSSFDAMLDSVAGAHGIRRVAISPDGQRVAWMEEGRGASRQGIFVCTLASPAFLHKGLDGSQQAVTIAANEKARFNNASQFL